MRLFVLSDPHLSGDPPQKTMDIFGAKWHDHRARLEENWRRLVGEDDYVLISGDISWAMRLEEALPDLYYLMDLPGKKILLRGNHDYWWSGVQKMNRVTQNKLFFLYNNYVPVGTTAICGTRGWLAPGDSAFTEADRTVFERETVRLERSLTLARQDGYTDFLVTLHYPPFNEKKEPTEMLKVAVRFGVRQLVYGHLHGEMSFRQVPQELEGVRLILASADYLDFTPLAVPLGE